MQAFLSEAFNMANSVFFDLEFIVLVASSLVVPTAIYFYLLRKQAISRVSILLFASVLIALSALDVYLLQLLAMSAKASLSKVDDTVFSSELSIAVYILPAVFAGIAVNLVSNILNKHLDAAELKFDQQASATPSPRRRP
ncbi:MAG: hypothetical protein ACOYNZ_14440 [Rhodoferax sp.]